MHIRDAIEFDASFNSSVTATVDAQDITCRYVGPIAAVIFHVHEGRTASKEADKLHR
jgi:hypothetical protein